MTKKLFASISKLSAIINRFFPVQMPFGEPHLNTIASGDGPGDPEAVARDTENQCLGAHSHVLLDHLSLLSWRTVGLPESGARIPTVMPITEFSPSSTTSEAAKVLVIKCRLERTLTQFIKTVFSTDHNCGLTILGAYAEQRKAHLSPPCTWNVKSEPGEYSYVMMRLTLVSCTPLQRSQRAPPPFISAGGARNKYFEL